MICDTILSMKNNKKAVLEAEKMLEVIERDPQANDINNIAEWAGPIFAVAIGQVILESFAKIQGHLNDRFAEYKLKDSTENGIASEIVGKESQILAISKVCHLLNEPFHTTIERTTSEFYSFWLALAKQEYAKEVITEHKKNSK